MAKKKTITKIGYRPNWQALPIGALDPEITNFIIAITAGMYLQFGGIDHEAYSKLTDWQKAHWVSYKYESEE